MNEKIRLSLSRDKKIVNLIMNTNKSIINNFIYKVKIKKQKYLKMVKDRYISTLLDFALNDIQIGCEEIKLKFKNEIKFSDKLRCIIIKR
jgi:hypothetical protein